MILVALMQNVCMCSSRINKSVSNNGRESESHCRLSARKPSKATHYIKSHPMLLIIPKELLSITGFRYYRLCWCGSLNRFHGLRYQYQNQMLRKLDEDRDITSLRGPDSCNIAQVDAPRQGVSPSPRSCSH